MGEYILSYQREISNHLGRYKHDLMTPLNLLGSILGQGLNYQPSYCSVPIFLVSLTYVWDEFFHRWLGKLSLESTTISDSINILILACSDLDQVQAIYTCLNMIVGSTNSSMFQDVIRCTCSIVGAHLRCNNIDSSTLPWQQFYFSF